jgi:hypothetical protein
MDANKKQPQANQEQMEDLNNFVRDSITEGGTVKVPYHVAHEEVVSAISSLDNPPPYTSEQIDATLDNNGVGPNSK